MGVMIYAHPRAHLIGFPSCAKGDALGSFCEQHTSKGKNGGDFDEAAFLTTQIALGVTALRDCSSASTLLWPCLVARENGVSPELTGLSGTSSRLSGIFTTSSCPSRAADESSV